MNKRIRWGVLSTAQIGIKTVIPAMKRASNLELYALAGRDEKKTREAADKLDIPVSFGSYEALLQDPLVEAVYIPLPNHLHVPWILKSLEAGKAVLCEKPLALTAAEVQTLRAARDRTGLPVGEAFMVKLHPQWVRAEEMVKNGDLGEIRAIQGVFSYFNDNPGNIRNRKDYGGGGIYDIGCYPIMTSRMVLGEEPRRVLALTESDPRFGVDRLASAILDFPYCQASFISATQMVPFQRIRPAAGNRTSLQPLAGPGNPDPYRYGGVRRYRDDRGNLRTVQSIHPAGRGILPGRAGAGPCTGAPGKLSGHGQDLRSPVPLRPIRQLGGGGKRMTDRFKALWVEEKEGKYSLGVTLRNSQDLPPGEVTIRVRYSCLNYKDALSASGSPGVTRSYPHTPGIDAAGEVLSCTDDSFRPGEQVVVTGWDLGMNTSGGLSQLIRVPSSWVLPLPRGLSARTAMIYGTAGLTAALSVDVLSWTVAPTDGDVLVTGASGGVGSVAVALLAKLGYAVTAVTGKPEARDFLKTLGARDFLSRQEAEEGSDRPILKGRWAGAVDSVGGNILSAAVKACLPGGVVTCCGNAASGDLDLTVFPFILRGVSLRGIDSQHCPQTLRTRMWELLSGAWRLPEMEDQVREISLEEAGPVLAGMIRGEALGRTLVKID